MCSKNLISILRSIRLFLRTFIIQLCKYCKWLSSYFSLEPTVSSSEYKVHLIIWLFYSLILLFQLIFLLLFYVRDSNSCHPREERASSLANVRDTSLLNTAKSPNFVSSSAIFIFFPRLLQKMVSVCFCSFFNASYCRACFPLAGGFIWKLYANFRE